MSANFESYIQRFHFTEEGREMFVSNIQNLVRNASDTPGVLPLNPAYFWDDNDLARMDQTDKEKLLDWLCEEALAASKAATEDYNYAAAPASIEEVEEEVMMIQLAGAIHRVLQLRDRSHLSVVLSDEQGRPYRRYFDGRIEYIKQMKNKGK